VPLKPSYKLSKWMYMTTQQLKNNEKIKIKMDKTTHRIIDKTFHVNNQNILLI
jgi:hypothetical protein